MDRTLYEQGQEPGGAWVSTPYGMKRVDEGWSLELVDGALQWHKVITRKIARPVLSNSTGGPLTYQDVAWDATGDAATATFYWSQVEGATSYKLEQYVGFTLVRTTQKRPDERVHSVVALPVTTTWFKLYAVSEDSTSDPVVVRLSVGQQERRYKSPSGGVEVKVPCVESGTWSSGFKRWIPKPSDPSKRLLSSGGGGWCDTKLYRQVARGVLDGTVLAQGTRLSLYKDGAGKFVEEIRCGPMYGLARYKVEDAKSAFYESQKLPAGLRGKEVVKSASLVVRRVKEGAPMYQERVDVYAVSSKSLSGNPPNPNPAAKSWFLASAGDAQFSAVLGADVAKALWSGANSLLIHRVGGTPNAGDGSDVVRYEDGYCRFYGVEKSKPYLSLVLTLEWDWVEKPEIRSVWAIDPEL